MKRTRTLRRNFLFLSIACHLIIFLFFLSMHLTPVKREVRAKIEIPAYVYQIKNPPPMPLGAVPDNNDKGKNLHMSEKIESAEKIKSSEYGIASAKGLMRDGMEKPTFAEITPSLDFNQYKASVQNQKKLDAVHLLGEKMIDDPLRKLIGIALTKHLVYPELAGRLYIHGIVSIGIMLYPDGRITEITLLKSSQKKILDVAALNAIQDSSPIKNIDIYLHKPRRMVINIIFR